MVLDVWSPIRQDEKPLVKNIKLFITPICIALVIQDMYLYYKFNKIMVK